MQLINSTRVVLSKGRAGDLLPAIRFAQSNGAVSLRDIAAVLNESGIPAVRGGEVDGSSTAHPDTRLKVSRST